MIMNYYSPNCLHQAPATEQDKVINVEPSAFLIVRSFAASASLDHFLFILKARIPMIFVGKKLKIKEIYIYI